MTDLTPCPFCGSHDAAVITAPTIWPVAQCNSCGARATPASWIGGAATNWNTRSAQEPAPAEQLPQCGGSTADRGAAEAARKAAATAPEPALRPMGEAPRDGTWVVLALRPGEFAAPAVVARTGHAGSPQPRSYWWTTSMGYDESDCIGWLPLPGSEDGWRSTHRNIYQGYRARVLARRTVLMEHGETGIPVVVFDTDVPGSQLAVWHEREFNGCFTLLPPEGDR